MRSVPNYLSTLANGDVQALFTGGIEILAGDSDTPPNARQIRWVRQADGSLVANILAYDVPPNPGAGLNDLVGSTWRVQSSYQPISGSLSISTPPFGTPGMRVQAIAGGDINTIANSLGPTTFLRKPLIGLNVGIRAGTTNLGGFGGGAGLNAILNHDLGVVPAAVLLTATDCNIAGDTNAATNIAVGSVTDTIFVVRVRTPGYAASASSINVHWIVIG